MSKKTRYILILTGFIIFLILAPTIVLYVRGISYDLKDHKFVKTGILAVRAEPKSVKVLLNDDEALDSSGDIRFLRPGEYNVTIQKDGYFDWSKRLPVLAGQVTWANPAPNKLFMFRKDPNITDASSNVTDFYANDSTIAYVTGNDLVLSSPNNPSQSENFSLPKRVSAITASPNGQTFILTDPVSSVAPPVILAFDKNNHNFTDLTGIFNAPAVLKFSKNNQLYALSGQTLYRVDLGQKAKTAVKGNVLAFTFRENDMYYLQQDGDQTSLMTSPSPEEAGTVVLSNLPTFSQGEIFVNFERQGLLLLDGTLYAAASPLQKLADNLNTWEFDYNESSLIFSHNGELDYYNPFQHNISFVTRSSSGITNPILNLAFNNAFFIRDNQLEALELDTRDHQNDYVLYKGDNLQKFSLDSAASTAYVLDNGTLKVLRIR